MKRGEIWQVDLGGKSGTRPALILTRCAVIPFLNKLTVAEITSHSKGYPTEVDIDQMQICHNLLLYKSITFKPSLSSAS